MNNSFSFEWVRADKKSKIPKKHETKLINAILRHGLDRAENVGSCGNLELTLDGIKYEGYWEIFEN